MNTRASFLLVSALAIPATASEPAAPADTGDAKVDASAPSALPAPLSPPIDPPSSPEAAPTRAAVAGAAEHEVVEAREVAPERFSVDLFSRHLIVRDDAFGLVSRERALGLGGLAVGATVFRDGPWSLRAGAAIEGRDALNGTARGVSVSVALNRPTARGEAAYALNRIFDAVAGVGVGAEKLEFRYAATGSDGAASTESWKPTADLAAGVDAHVRLGPVLVGARVEGGYLVSGSHALRVTLADVGDVTRQSIDLGTLSTGGPFTRFALRVAY